MRELGESRESTNVSSLAVTVEADDTYYLKVMFWWPATTYDLNIEVTGP
jgi:hypothetical protein